MKFHKTIFSSFVIVCFVQFVGSAQINANQETIPREELETYNIFPAEISNVNDLEKIFDFREIQELEKLIAEYERRTSHGITIFTVKSIEPYDSMQDYAKYIFNRIEKDKLQKDNGITIILSKHLKEVRISTGSEVDEFLTDQKCNEIIENHMIPKLRENKYFEATKNGVLEIMQLL